VGPRAGLDGCGKSRLHRDFFSLSVLLSVFVSFVPIGKRSAADPRRRPLGHWDQFDPGTVQSVASRSTD
jgi:hypothetical protein